MDDLKSAVAQKIVQLRRTNGEVGDILHEIDPTEELNRQMGILYYETTRSIEFWIEHENVEEMVAALENATRLRREFRAAVEKMFQKG